MADAGVWVELTDANIRHNHIYLRKVLPFFPEESIGGSNHSAASIETITVQFDPGEKVETDLAGDKKFLRERGAVGDFFRRTSAKGGDLVLITRISSRNFKFELIKR